MTSEEVELLSELTIVIPTFNRPLELERAIEYWRDLPITVHILDGSVKPYFKVGVLPVSANLFYHHLPRMDDEDPMVNFARRLTFGATLPTTKFSATCSDDDFFTKSALLSSLKLLDNEPLLDGAVGRVVSYSIDGDEIGWTCKYASWNDSDDARSDSIERRSLRKKNWFLYAICRTDLWRDYVFQSYKQGSFTEDQFYAHEWLMLRFSNALFKVKFQNEVFIVRQATQYGVNKPSILTWQDWLTNSAYADQVQDLLQRLSVGFGLVSGNLEENNLLAQQIISGAIQKVGEDRNKLNSKNKFRFNQALLNIIPNRVKELMVYLLPIEEAVYIKYFSLQKLQKLLSVWGCSFKGSDLETIERILLMPREELRLRANI